MSERERGKQRDDDQTITNACHNKWVVIRACLVVFVVFFSLCVIAQMMYQSWSTKRLLSQLSSADDATRYGAFEELQEKNINILPTLIELLNHSDSDVRESAAWNLNTHVLPVPHEVVHVFLVIAKDESEDEHLRWIAIDTLGKYGQQDRGPLTELEETVLRELCLLLENEKFQIAVFAADAIAGFSTRAGQATDSLRQALHTDSQRAQISVANALIAVNSRNTELALPVLIEAAISRDASVSHQAVIILGELGAQAEAAIPALEELQIKDPESFYLNEALNRIRAEIEQLAQDSDQ